MGNVATSAPKVENTASSRPESRIRWQSSQLGVVDKVILHRSAHFKSPVITEVQHPSWVNLTPVLPSVALGHSVVFLSVLVNRDAGGLPDAIRAEPGVERDIVSLVQHHNVVI